MILMIKDHQESSWDLSSVWDDPQVWVEFEIRLMQEQNLAEENPSKHLSTEGDVEAFQHRLLCWGVLKDFLQEDFVPA